jgi:DNA-binding response OmpR family regulator
MALSWFDVRAFEQAAHALKGMLANFAAKAALDTASALEEIGRTETIPIIVLSANHDPSVAARALSCGADQCIVKPTSSESIAETLAALLARAKQHEKIATTMDRKPKNVEPIIESRTRLHAILVCAVRSEAFSAFRVSK